MLYLHLEIIWEFVEYCLVVLQWEHKIYQADKSKNKRN